MHKPFLTVLQDFLVLLYFSGEDSPFQVSFEPGSDNARLLVVTGDNIGGKSFLLSALGEYARKYLDTPYIETSMRMRTSAGLHRAFMYGSDQDQSTGMTSVKSVMGAMRTCEQRTEAHYLLLDEPDTGLSEGYQRALGEKLGRFANNLPAQTHGMVVTSHSRPLVRELVACSQAGGLSPHRLRMGDDLRPTRQWLDEGSAYRSLEDLERLMGMGRERMGQVNRAIRRVRSGDS